MHEVVSLGILVADFICSPIDRLPRAGELTLAERFALRIGGCAANTGVDLRRLGRTVAVAGKVGADLFGDFIVSELGRAGIRAAVARAAAHPTSATMIVNVRGEDRRFIHCIGANADFRLADIDLSLLEGARILYLGGFMLMPAFTAADLASLFSAARGRGIRTVLDVVIPVGHSGLDAGFAEVLRHTDVFLPNSDEARALTGESDPFRQASALARFNAEGMVIVTMGAEGLVAIRGNEALRAGAYRVESIDESGAGDAFCAGVIAGILEDWPLERIIRFASAVGASCTRALGCTDGVFDMHQATAFMAGHSLEVEPAG